MTSDELDRKMGEAFEGDYLKALDLMHLERAETKATISGITLPNTEKSANKKLINKTIISFKDRKKRMILATTNVDILRSLYGSKVSQWIGKEVTIGVRYIDAFGYTDVPSLRIIPPDSEWHRIGKGLRDRLGTVTPSKESGNVS
jgi:hypothetical protein